MALVTDP